MRRNPTLSYQAKLESSATVKLETVEAKKRYRKEYEQYLKLLNKTVKEN